VTFTAPANNGAAINGYSAKCTSSNGGVAKTATRAGSSSTPISVTGLTQFKTYTCTVTASNSRGVSPASVPSAAVNA
jgi:hypothetical protein